MSKLTFWPPDDSNQSESTEEGIAARSFQGALAVMYEYVPIDADQSGCFEDALGASRGLVLAAIRCVHDDDIPRSLSDVQRQGEGQEIGPVDLPWPFRPPCSIRNAMYGAWWYCCDALPDPVFIVFEKSCAARSVDMQPEETVFSETEDEEVAGAPPPYRTADHCDLKCSELNATAASDGME